MRPAAKIVIALLLLSASCNTQPLGASQDKPVFRAPFVLNLRVDNEHNYRQKFGQIPYVAHNEVYLFAGDSFGVNVTVAVGQKSQISYEPNHTQADVEFSFSQQRGPHGMVMMLVIRSKLKRRLFIDALMTIPGRSGIYETSILPVPPGLTDYESWPHPIVQLVLRNFRFTDKESASAVVGK